MSKQIQFFFIGIKIYHIYIPILYLTSLYTHTRWDSQQEKKTRNWVMDSNTYLNRNNIDKTYIWVEELKEEMFMRTYLKLSVKV